jgi:hypothetical protein
VEELFLAGMRKCYPLGASRYILGAHHILFSRGVWPLHTIPTLFFMLVLTMLTFGYILPPGAEALFFVLPALGAVQLDLIPHRSMLLPAGRSERYYGAMVSGLMITVITTLVVVLMAIISIPLVDILPDIAPGHRTYSFHAIDPRDFHIPLFLLPIALALGTLFSKKRLSFLLFAALASAGITALVLAVTFSAETMALLFPDSVLGVLALLAASWMVSAILLRYHCLRRSLVTQGG